MLTDTSIVFIFKKHVFTFTFTNSKRKETFKDPNSDASFYLHICSFEI